MKIAVLFPGIGYTCDKPLLYYAGKLACNYGYEVKPVPYGNFPAGVKGSQRKMEECFFSAMEQTRDILRDVNWDNYDDILFISKSIGTIVAAAYMKENAIKGRSISYTPLEDTFRFAAGDGIMFHGTRDPWAANSNVIRAECEKIGQPLYITDDGNHSLETGKVLNDINNLKIIMRQTEDFIKSRR